MKDQIWKIIVIVVIVAICGLAINPPRERLKLGKDLAGGTTLTYGVLPSKDDNRPPTSAEVQQIISVVHDRIDPKGIYDISIVAVGTNQIEISMPSPTPEVQALSVEFRNKLTKLGDTVIEGSDIDELVRMDEGAQKLRIDEFCEVIPERRKLFEEVIYSYNQMKIADNEYTSQFEQAESAIAPLAELRDSTRLALEQAEEATKGMGIDQFLLMQITNELDENVRGELINKLVDRAVEQGIDANEARAAILIVVEKHNDNTAANAEYDAAESKRQKDLFTFENNAVQAELNYEDARDALVSTNINTDELLRVLALDTNPIRKKEPGTENWIMGPSQRDIAFERLSTLRPMLTAQLDELLVAYDAYKSKSKGYDDPKELISLLRGAGVLEFRIAASLDDQLPPIETLRAELQKKGPTNLDSTDKVKWFALDKLEQWYDRPIEREYLMEEPFRFMYDRFRVICDEFDGQIYMLLYDTPGMSLTGASGDWKVTNAFSQPDDMGKPAVAFRLDVAGAQKFGFLTGNNKQRQMAIVLDDRVYSAPTIQSRITSQGRITGKFSNEEINYLLKVLNSGALQARLTEEPIAQQTIGPKLGLDNLMRGLNAGIIALIVVAIFMMIYYFFAGVVANVALICNAIIILGVMSLYEAAFTMPGIAGIVLTFGMAVDANVLIYERIREELESGEDLKTAIRLGYDKVLSTIIDANVTNLIVCFVLGLTATVEVRGFALTLGIGIIATLFSALFITRVIFYFYAHVFNAQKLPMLPSVFTALNRLLSPNIHWVNMRVPVWTISGLIVLASVIITFATWKDMLDTEFLGGSSVTFSFKTDPETGKLITLPREEVVRRLEDYAQKAYENGELGNDAAQNEEYNKALHNASVYNLNVDEIAGEDFSSSSFIVKTTIADPNVLEQVITSEETFGSILDIRQPLQFEGSDIKSPESAPIYPVLDANLGENIQDNTITNDVRRYLGGAVIVLKDINPVTSVEEIDSRIRRLRQTQEFDKYFGRQMEVIGLKRAEGKDVDGNTLWHDAVVLVKADNINIFQRASEWDAYVRDVEWDIVSRALTEPPSLDQITTVSATIAGQFRAKAIVAIGLSLLGILAYIWVRFGSFRYSIAAIIALMHDVLVTLGLLAATHYVYNTYIGQALYIEAFKIDLGVIAALLTIIGYSLNDTIVILDRIRENRGKLAITSIEVVNKSINQTFSRTLLTSGTTLLAVIIMYAEGGTGIRPFTFAMLCGVVVGTYSSIGIAAPMVYKAAKKIASKQEDQYAALDNDG